MKVIFDNIIFYLQRSGGGTVYWLELIKRAIGDPQIEECFSEPASELKNNFRIGLPLKVSLVEKFPLHWLRISNYSRRIKGKFIFHSSYYRISKSREVVNVVTIHDFTSELYLKGIRRFVHSLRKKNAIKNADGIICISNNTKNDLLNFYPLVDKNKIRVIYNGVGDEYHITSKSEIDPEFKYNYILKKKYVLYIGHRTSYKNFFTAVESISRLDESFNLLVIGEKLTPKETEKLGDILNNRYISLSGIDNSTLNIFYNFANCLIYPSSYEGFGIPILEAMKAGCPVVTTDKSSIPEVTGDAAIVVTKIDPESFVAAILKLQDENLKKEIKEKGLLQASKFSWDKTYNEVRDFYLQLINAK